MITSSGRPSSACRACRLRIRIPDGDSTGYSMLSSTEVDDEFMGALVDWLVDRLR